MSILPGSEGFPWRDDGLDELTRLIGELYEQAEVNFLKVLAAGAVLNREQVWKGYHEGVALEQDMYTLSRLYGRIGVNARKMPPQ
ncbi:MAG TPA: hypothetical protein PLD47_10850 [Aggregatilineales bacterium]|nr:hypothetical protein [Anaerolineales bacterium]HRE48213.1 hypothetical protein [Aggregatilineales bacterium]